MASEFTDDEQKLLQPFFTNLDKPVFALTNLPEVVKGALFSRYSRTDKSLRRVLLDEFIQKPEMGFTEIVGVQEAKGVEQSIAIKKAEEFYDRVLVGFGDDSVAELGGAHIALEEVSNMATKVVQDSRIGLSPLEKSTRYVYFDQKKNDKYLYYREPTLMQSEFAALYEKTCDALFDTYVKILPDVKKYAMEKNPQGDASPRAYTATIRAKACDLIRGLLPAATVTNTGVFGNGRGFEYLITKMYAHPLTEMKDLAKSMQDELSKTIPSFVKRANDQYGLRTIAYMQNSFKNTRALTAQDKPVERKWVQLVEWDDEAVEKVITAMLYPHSNQSLKQLREYVNGLNAEEKKKIVDAYTGGRENRRQKTGRAYEQAFYTFDILADYGAYRDLQRHRMLSQQRQLLSTDHGFDISNELELAGVADHFKGVMQQAKEAFDEIRKTYRLEAQYVVPLAYNIRWYFKMNAREVYHFTELRSARQGHPSYRKVAQEIYRLSKEKHPLLFEHCKFVDMKEYDLERLDAEKRIDKKLAEVEKKYGNQN